MKYIYCVIGGAWLRRDIAIFVSFLLSGCFLRTLLPVVREEATDHRRANLRHRKRITKNSTAPSSKNQIPNTMVYSWFKSIICNTDISFFASGSPKAGAGSNNADRNPSNNMPPGISKLSSGFFIMTLPGQKRLRSILREFPAGFNRQFPAVHRDTLAWRSASGCWRWRFSPGVPYFPLT